MLSTTSLLPTIAELSTSALIWHGVLLKLIKRTPGVTRIVLDVNKELLGLLKRSEELTWEQIIEATAAIQELTQVIFQFSVQSTTKEGSDITRLTSGPLWQLVEITYTADDDWTPEDETTWTPETVVLDVGSWWKRPKDVTPIDPRQMKIFDKDPADDIRLF